MRSPNFPATVFLAALLATGPLAAPPDSPPSGASGAALTGAAAPSPPAAPDSLKNPAPNPPPKRNLLAERLERKLRTEYLKATAGIQGPTLKAEALLPLLEDTNLVLLDIRQPDEQAVSMIPKAMTTQDFAARFRKGIPKGKRIVVYCTIGYRSGRYAMQLATQNIRAENLEGGLLAWSHVGGPLEVRNPDGLVTPTKRVHIYDKTWNFLHPDYQAVW